MVTINAINSNIPIEVSKGGANATSFSTATGLVKYDGTRLVTSSTATLNASNLLTNTAQPVFSAYLGNAVANATGKTAVYSVVCDQVTTNQGSYYNAGTGVFTAPVTGIYLFVTRAYITNCTIANQLILNLVTTPTTFPLFCNRTASAADLYYTQTWICPLTATNTAYFSLKVNGEAADTNTVYGNGGGNYQNTTFQGYLIC